jgi:hypothetical protein
MAAGAPNSKADHSRLFDILTNPWLAGFGSVAGILALLTGIYFFSLSQKYRGLAFYVQPVQGIVVRGAVYSGPKSRGLRVFYRNEEVATDVSTAQIAIWNQGTEAILPDDFLEPVRIVTRPAAKIFEVHVSKVSRSVIKFTADVTHLEHGEVPVSWRILEQGDGALVQLVYGGPSNVDVSLAGC